MNLNELDLLEFLPTYLRRDKTASGMAYAVTKILNEYVVKNIEKCNIYGRIDELDDVILDKLAWQFNVVEYIPTLDTATKRLLIKNCIEMHRQRGTVAAVEKVIQDVFGNGYVEEWFNYDRSKPFHFKIHTSNMSASDSMITEFEKLVENTQNVRSVLEEVVIETSIEMSTYYGVFSQSADIIYI